MTSSHDDFRWLTQHGRYVWGVVGEGDQTEYSIRDATTGAVLHGPYRSHGEQADGLAKFAALTKPALKPINKPAAGPLKEVRPEGRGEECAL